MSGRSRNRCASHSNKESGTQNGIDELGNTLHSPARAEKIRAERDLNSQSSDLESDALPLRHIPDATKSHLLQLSVAFTIQYALASAQVTSNSGLFACLPP